MRQRNNSSIKLLSIIVPAYKQEKTIVQDIQNIQKELQQLHCKYEILVVVDGIVDKTFDRIKAYKSQNIKIIAYDENQGKGQAVRYGMMHAKGDVIGFIDAGMDID